MASLLSPERQKFEVEFMADPMRWPHLMLPVKRTEEINGFHHTRVGSMVAIEGFLTYVFKESFFRGEKIMNQVVHLHETGKPLPNGVNFIKYDSYQAILDDGWRIDD